MGAVGQRPGFLDRGIGGEPQLPFAPPRGEVARLGQAPGIAREIENALERQRISYRLRVEREQPLEMLVGEGQLALCIELGNTRRQLVKHRPLRLAKGAKRARQLLHVLDIDGIAGDALRAERQVADPERPALTADGRGHHPLDRRLPLRRGQGHRRRRLAIDGLDQLGSGRDHLVRAHAPDCRDIGRIDQPQLALGPAKPHRHRRRLDQPDQRGEVGPRPLRLGLQPIELARPLARIEGPHQRRAAR